MNRPLQRLLTKPWRNVGNSARIANGTKSAVASPTSRSLASSSAGEKDPTLVKPYLSGESTHFGFEQVRVQEKEQKVRQVFDNVADSYDLMNDFMSAGVHRLWKDYLLDQSAVEPLAKAARAAQLDFKILDVAGGTGDGT